MKNIEMIPSEKTFVEWAMKEDMELTEQEAGLILGYVLGHGYGVCLDATDTIILVDTEEPENGIVAKGIDELIDRINTWNCEFLEDDEVTGEYREQFVKDSEMLDSIFDRLGTRNGYPIQSFQKGLYLLYFGGLNIPFIPNFLQLELFKRVVGNVILFRRPRK